MGFNADLRLVIKALCAPAALALLPNPGAAHADITASNASYVYVGTGFRNITMFRLNVADNQAFVPGVGTFQLVEVNGSPRPVQLIEAGLTNDPQSGVLATLTRFQNCLTVTVTSPPVESESTAPNRTGTFSIDYAVTDGRSQQVSRATMQFRESEFYNFTTMNTASPRCDDPAFAASQAFPDTAKTTAGTPVTINVLANDSLPENEAPTLIVRGSQSGATVQVKDNGTITYVPAEGFTGTDTFEYMIRDYSERGFEDLNPSTTVTVNVAPVTPSIATIIVNETTVESGASINIADKDALAGETVRFDGSQSTLSSGKPPTSFQWFVNEELQQEGSSPIFEPTLNDGTSLVSLTVSDGEAKASSSVVVNVAEHIEPPNDVAIIAVNDTVVEDGGNIAVADTDLAPGENVELDGSRTLIFGRVKPTRFQWFVNGSSTPQQDGDNPTFEPRLIDGISRVRLVASATDGESESQRIISATAEIGVTVAAPPSEDTAIIAVNGTVVTDGGNISVPDTDAAPGEGVSFDGSQTLIFGELRPTRFRWFVGDSATAQQDGDNPLFAPRLPDGTSQVRLVAIFEGEGTISASSVVNVTVAPAVVTPPAPSAATILVNGADVTNGTLSLTDSDAAPGEKTTFDGSQSTVAGARPTRFQWFVNDTLQKDSSEETTFEFTLGDGASSVRLIASNGETSAASVVNVTVGGVAILADIPNLTPNQREIAKALDSICSQLVQRLQSEQALSADQQDLLERCQGILLANSSDQARALDELSAQDFNAARLQTLLFTNTLYAGVMDRLMALRGGVKGLSLAGLNVVIDGQSVPLAALEQMFGQLLGGGAAADEPGSLLGDKWGAWSRGNFTFGSKEASNADNGFDAEQFSLTAGLDYRLSDKMVIGGAIAFGSSNISYDPNNEGGLDTQTWAVSIYGSRYAAKNFYVDALVNAANSSFEAHRRITYNDALGSVQRDARGDTDGLTLSGGLSGGYDFLFKGWTLSPTAGFFYVDSTIDSFREDGSRGLNLIYEEQNFESLTTTLGMRVNYAWNLPWGVVIPYFRGDYVLELKDDVEAFSVRFASDPGSPATPIIVKSDNPDQSYFRLVAGVSGQFPFGISGYVEYQRLQGFEFVSFNDLSMGLRVQYRY